MHRYLAKAAAVALTLLCLHFLIVVFVQSPISAEYWVREAIIVKRHLASQLASPKLIFLGGSSTLFGIDARVVERELGVPAINYGLHGCLHFSILAREAGLAAKPGDVIVLPIEPSNYLENRDDWTDCQLRIAIAWGKDYLDALPLYDRLRFAFVAGGPFLSLEIIAAKIGAFVAPGLYGRRLRALAPPEEIVARYDSGTLRTADFAYSAYNLSERGDVTNAEGNHYQGQGALVMAPGPVSLQVKAALTGFVAEMKNRGVRVVIAHAPYLVERKPGRRWRVAERRFAADVMEIGAQLLDRRDELFLPRSNFFDTLMHLNETGRRVRTGRLIADLRGLGIGLPAAGAVSSAGAVAK